MKKRLASLLLALCMILSLLPGTAYAAVADLLENTAQQNQSLLQQLESFTGESYEEAYALLDSLGLLDGDGNLVTDQSIVLNGVAYTLEQAEAILADPSVDLTQVATVDGVPIALSDLKTIIAIERQLQYLQETYFTGRTFDGEALENVNSLLAQLQSEGMTLNADARNTENRIVFDTNNLQQTSSDGRPIYYISTGTVTIPAGTTLSVKFKLNLSDAIKKDLFLNTMPAVYLSDTPTSSTLSSYYLSNDGKNSEIIYIQNSVTTAEEYTLSVTANYPYEGPLYLCLWGPSLQSGATLDYETNFAKYSYGTLWQAVSFYNAQGFLFGNGSTLSDQWNGYFSVEHAQPSMQDSCSVTGSELSFTGGRNFLEFYLVGSDATAVDYTLTFLQRCITNLKRDNAVRFQLNATLAQTNNESHPLIIPKDVFIHENSGRDDLEYHGYYIIEESSLTGNFPITLASGSGTTTISFTGLTDKFNSSDGKSCILPRRFSTVMCNSTSVTPAQIDDISNISQYTYSIDNFTSTTNCTINLVNDNIKPTLAVSAPAGSYQSGDVIPITITGDEFIKVNNPNSTYITINNQQYTLAQLHGSTSGKYITFFYEVKEIDNATLTVGIASNSGITDYWGNAANEVNNVSVSGVSITSPLLKNAVTDLTASYNADTQMLTFGIAVNQDSSYQNLYNVYKDDTMQLLVSVDGAAAETLPVTMGGSGNIFTFTAEDYKVPQTTADQIVTVQLQINNGNDGWTTLGRLTTSVTIAKLVDVTGVTISVVGKPEDYNYTIALSDEEIPQLEASVTPSDATYKTGTWSSNNPEVADITQDGQIQLKSVTGTVSFRYTADNGTPDYPDDDEYADSKEFTITAGNQLYLGIPKYAQESLIQAGSAATVTWNTNVFAFYPEEDVTFTIKLYAGTDTTGTPKIYTVENPADSETKVTSLIIPPEDLPVSYPQSQYTVEVSMSSPEERYDTASITVLSPPTEMRLTAAKTSITDIEQLTLTCSISNNSATGALSVKRVADGAANAEDVTSSCLSGTSVSNGGGTITFKPLSVTGGLYDTYTITFTENTVTASPNFAPSSDSLVLRVYRSGALQILHNGQDGETIDLSNQAQVSGTLPTKSEDILALRQQLGLIEYIGINADAYNWGSFSDGIKWVSDHPESVGVYYRQGGLWDNIEDLPYETYVPQSEMAVSATDDVKNVTITATHAATGMTDSVKVNVNTLREKFYLFQVTPAEETTLTYTNGDGKKVTATTNSDGLLALYEPSGIKSDVMFRSGDGKNPNLGTLQRSALTSGERDAAKLQLYPLNTITLAPAAQMDLYLVQPDGSPYVGSVTLRGGVYLAGYYCEGVHMGSSAGNLVPGDTDGTYTTNADGKLTVYMDATQFKAEGYDGPLTNAALDYWFELSDLGGDKYYPTLVNIQGSMSADYTLRTGSAVVTLREVSGQAKEPFLIAQTLSYGKDSKDDLQVRNVMGSTGKVGPNSTYKYTELTTRIMLWGVEADDGAATVTMTGSNGFAPKAQTVDDNSFPFASIPIVTNTLVLTKETMTESGWLEAETAENLKASVYQNDALVKTVSMPFQVIDLTDVKLVDQDAQALVLDMTANLQNGFGTTDSSFSFGNNMVGNAFSGKITSILNGVQENVNPLFRVLITPTADNTVFNVLVWGGYDSLDMDDFDYSSTGLTMDYGLMEAELDVGVPPLNDASAMAMGTYDPIGSVNEVKYNRTNSGLDIGAQLTGYYEGQFYYDTDLHKWAFRTLGGGMSAGTSLSFQANINAWVGPVPITATFGAGIGLQLSFKAATVYTDQEANTSGWTSEALKADSVTDYLTTLRIQGYIDAFGGLGFDYSVLALKIGLFGRLSADSTNTFLSQTYLQNNQQRNGQALGISGEVGIKFFAKFLFVSYEAVIGSGSISYKKTFNDYTYINNYWNGGSGTLQMGAPTLLSRSYLEAYANGQRNWATPGFSSDASVVLEDANPGSEPAVNDDGSLSVYISDMISENYFDSRIKAGPVGTDGTVIDNDGDLTNNGCGDMSPSVSGTSSFTVAAWIRLFEDLEKSGGEAITPAEEKQLLNSTEIMVATTTDNGSSWIMTQLTDNASPDLAPVTAVSGSNAAVFWRSVYTSSSDPFPDNQNVKLDFDTQDTIYVSRYNGSWSSQPTMVYNGSSGSVAGIQSAMLPDGTAIVVFILDRNPNNDVTTDYELAYRVVKPDNTLGDLVILTNDSDIDTNPQVVAVTNGSESYFVLGWYSSQNGGDICLQAVGSNGQLYSGNSSYALSTSVNAIASQDDLTISADFRFAKAANQSIDGLTLVWAETAANTSGQADHSVLYGTQLRQIDGKLYLSSPQALITLPDRTLANSFSAWQTGNQVSAYIFGTWYSPTEKETVPGYSTPVAKDTDQLLTGAGTFAADALSVDAIAVDYGNLRVKSLTQIVFTLRNTGTTKLSDVVVSLEGGYNSSAVTLLPGESADVPVLYKTGATITNPGYTVGSGLASGTLYLDYNDIGISSMEVVSENEGDRTTQVTLYNDSAAKLEGSGRTVELSFYTDAEYTKPANVTLAGSQSSSSTITLSGDALKRIDQGAMTLLVTFDLASHVNGLGQDEVPASGVYLYAKATVKDSSGKAMAEYASGNNSDAVQLTGAYARTGEKTSLDVTITNSSVTEARVDLKNNCLTAQPDNGTLLAVLLDKDGNALETQVVIPDTALTCEQAKSVTVTFTQLGADVIVVYAAGGTGLQALQFSGMDVDLEDFTENPEKPGEGEYIYTLPVDAPASTVVSFISSEAVSVNGTEYDKAGSAVVSIPGGTSTITVTTGNRTYILTLNRSGSGGFPGGITTSYSLTFNTNGGSTINTITRPKGTVIDLAGYLPTKEGYFFGGWYTEPELINRVTSVTLNTNMTLYARWTDNPFLDVPDDAYYFDPVMWAVKNGVTDGTSAITFSPNDPCTRAHAVTFLWRAYGSPEPTATENPFSDVSTDNYFYKAVLWAVEQGITLGTSETTFSPNAPCTRAQIVTFLYRASKAASSGAGVNPFTDVSADSYYYEAVLWAAGAGITAGTSETTFSPNDPCTRGQIVTFLYRQLGQA